MSRSRGAKRKSTRTPKSPLLSRLEALRLSVPSDWTVWAAVGDTHAPWTDWRAFAEVERILVGWKPKVLVHLGDLLEGQAASRWPEENKVPLTTEFDEAAKVLVRLRTCVPGARCVLLDGNHDDNVISPNRIPKELREACLPARDKVLGSELDRWERVPYVNNDDGAFWLGKICFKHGYSSNEDIEALVFAGDTPSALVVGGHTHTPREVTRCMRTKRVPLHVWYANAGTLGPLKPEFARREDTRGWGPAVVIGACKEKGRYEPGRNWIAETIRV